MRREIQVKAFWDAEAGVWVAQSKDVPGLITEAETMEHLVAKLQVMIPELLEANGMLDDKDDAAIPFHLLGERTEKAFRPLTISFMGQKGRNERGLNNVI